MSVETTGSMPFRLRRSIGLDVGPNSPGNSFRERRFAWFLALLEGVEPRQRPLRILDVGGTIAYWGARMSQLEGRDFRITVLNRSVMPVDDPRFVSVSGDARDLSQFGDDSFDIVHSNSVIEHVGRWPDMAAMAREIRRVAPAHFVQTPYFWFPIEPHCRTAFIHWLPESWRFRLVMSRRLGFWPKARDVDTAMNQIQSAVLLDGRMYRALFPDSEIRHEKVFALTKSLVAIRQARTAA